jgi:hypothetical protein
MAAFTGESLRLILQAGMLAQVRPSSISMGMRLQAGLALPNP